MLSSNFASNVAGLSFVQGLEKTEIFILPTIKRTRYMGSSNSKCNMITHCYEKILNPIRNTGNYW